MTTVPPLLRPGPRRPGHRRDDGMIAVEAVAATPLVIFVGLLALQVGLIFAGVTQANGAARAAARADGLGLGARAAAEASLPGWLQRDLRVSSSGDGRVDLELRVPSVVPLLPTSTVHRTVTMPAAPRAGG